MEFDTFNEEKLVKFFESENKDLQFTYDNEGVKLVANDEEGNLESIHLDIFSMKMNEDGEYYPNYEESVEVKIRDIKDVIAKFWRSNWVEMYEKYEEFEI